MNVRCVLLSLSASVSMAAAAGCGSVINAPTGGPSSTGCSAVSSSSAPASCPIRTSTQGISFKGEVIAGLKPVSGATVQLYAAGTAGNGSAPAALLTTAASTGAGGAFIVPGGYSCPSAETPVYLISKGGQAGLEIDKHISEDFLTISIEQKARHGKVEKRLKTASATRKVDLHPAVAAMLREFVGTRKTGFLFRTRKGNPVGPSNILRRHLHPALKQLGYNNPFTGTSKAGNHAFRRFRNTHLRNRSGCPEGLQNFWMGHADETMGDLYDKIKEDVEFRKEWAEKCGFGFELPSVVPNVPKIAGKTEVAKAA